jgi:hypothetical protein
LLALVPIEKPDKFSKQAAKTKRPKKNSRRKESTTSRRKSQKAKTPRGSHIDYENSAPLGELRRRKSKKHEEGKTEEPENFKRAGKNKPPVGE